MERSAELKGEALFETLKQTKLCLESLLCRPNLLSPAETRVATARTKEGIRTTVYMFTVRS